MGGADAKKKKATLINRCLDRALTDPELLLVTGQRRQLTVNYSSASDTSPVTNQRGHPVRCLMQNWEVCVPFFLEGCSRSVWNLIFRPFPASGIRFAATVVAKCGPRDAPKP